jgi:F-type H+-transporting ATPase subunit b
MMRRAVLVIMFGLALACCVPAQERAETKQESSEDSLLMWKWANFAILVIGLGYLIGKNVPPLFRKRAQEIEQSIADAAGQKKDAEARAAAMDLRLSGLAAEIERLRSDAHTQATSENERIGRETQGRLAKIQNQSAAEIALMTRAGREELRRYAAGLALDLAEQRIRSRVTPNTQETLVDGFLEDLRYRVQPGGRA